MLLARKVVGRSFLMLLLVAVVAGIYLVGSGQWQLRPVDSGSMRPMLPVGSVAFVQREPTSNMAVGQVVLTHPPMDVKSTVIHRIISMTPDPQGVVVQTKGDANPVADTWQVHVLSSHVYVERFEVPVLGRIAYAVHSPRGRAVLLSLALVLMVMAICNFTWNRRRRGRHAAGALMLRRKARA